MKNLIFGTLIVMVMFCYFLYAIHEKGIWAGLFFVFVSFLALLYHIFLSQRAAVTAFDFGNVGGLAHVFVTLFRGHFGLHFPHAQAGCPRPSFSEGAPRTSARLPTRAVFDGEGVRADVGVLRANLFIICALASLVRTSIAIHNEPYNVPRGTLFQSVPSMRL